MSKNLKMLDRDKVEFIFKKLSENYLKDKAIIYTFDKTTDIEVKNSFHIIIKSIVNNNIENLTSVVKKIAVCYNDYRIPYISLVNEINYIEKELLRLIINNNESNEALKILKLFDKLEELIVSNFLFNYLEVLKKENNLRLHALENTLDDKMMSYYRAHIIWVNNLAEALLTLDSNKIPEIHHHKCSFGQWLDSENAQSFIGSSDNYLELYHIHKQLHSMAYKISLILTNKTNDYHDCLVYIQKAENISKEIGSKLSFFSNKITLEESIKDPLTGVLNRSLMSKLFLKEYDLHSTIKSSFAIAMCDLDHFKAINDTYGHLAGDEVLRFFSNLLKEHFRDSDIIIRYGGEEFVIMLPATKISQAIIIFEKFRDLLEKSTIIYEDTSISVTVSIGLIEITSQSESNIYNLEYCLAQVDGLLYKAKSNGRNRIESSII